VNGLPLPLADLAGLISTVVFIVFVLLSALSHMVKSRDDPQRRPPVPRPQPPRDRVQAELDDFLQGAQRRRPAPPRPSGPPPIPGGPPYARPPQPSAAPVEAEVVEVAAGSQPPGAVHAPVGVQVPGGSPHSGQPEYALGILVTVPGAPGQAPTTTITVLGTLAPSSLAGNLAALLAHPASVQQAVLLSEILKRPEERWDRDER
jgi:hypothetical protein